MGGDFWQEQGLLTEPCGDRRAPAGASRGLLRDERGMSRCLICKRALAGVLSNLLTEDSNRRPFLPSSDESGSKGKREKPRAQKLRKKEVRR
jgi:hypothetical protein